MAPQELFQSIRNYCLANYNETNVKRFSYYFREGYDGYGLSHPQVQAKAREISANESLDIQLVLEASRLLVETRKFEETLFAILLLKKFSKQFDLNVFNEIEAWFAGYICNWAHTDGISGDLLSELLIRNGISIENLRHWMNAQNKFQRRAVPVSLIKLIKKKRNHQELFDFIEPLILDSQREVHQGIGWFLREAWKIDPMITEHFLLKWKDKAPRLIIQYATEKMTKDYKERFRKNKQDQLIP